MGLFSKKEASKVEWKMLDHPELLDELTEVSMQTPVLLFKHSTRCSISSMAKHRLESGWNLTNEQIIPVYLDLLKYRNISNLIAEKFDVQHESPQVILLKNGKCVYSASHNAIDVSAIKDEL